MSEIYLFSLIFGGVFTFVGLIFLIIGIAFFMVNKKKAKNCTEFATATIIDVVKGQTSSGDGYVSTSFAPIYEYYDGTRQVRVQRSYWTPYNSCGQIGDSVEIYYNPEKTTQIVICGDKSSVVFTAVFTVIGAIFTGIGFIALGYLLYNLLF